MIPRSKYLKFYTFVFLIIITVLGAGCAEIELPGTKEMIKEPLGQGALRVGMTTSQVVSIYGDPDVKNSVTSVEWGSPREEWLYKARYSGLPVGTGYLTEDLYLYFDGDNLTNISRKPLGKSETFTKENERIK